MGRAASLKRTWAIHDSEWRDPAQAISQWSEAGRAEPGLLRYSVRGKWWQTLADHQITLVVTREYEHVAIAMSPTRESQTYMRVPHPSGVAADRKRGQVHLALTRNPNQVMVLAPVNGLEHRTDVHVNGRAPVAHERPLIPLRSTILPGSLYIHDLALIGSNLYANAVGQNCVVRVDPNGGYKRAWWPRCIETAGGPQFSRNHIQLNSIAAGQDLKASFFSASTDRIGNRRPSHRNFAVDGRGVVFAGSTREVVARGLTRPHSARFHGQKLWVDNSGYGEVGVIERDKFEPRFKLPGWTRGLCFHAGVAFVGTSRVLPRFSQFAPGVDQDRAVCGVHALDLKTGAVLGSVVWPAGNQIFGIEWLPATLTGGLPFRTGRREHERERLLFYAFNRGGAVS